MSEEKMKTMTRGEAHRRVMNGEKIEKVWSAEYGWGARPLSWDEEKGVMEEVPVNGNPCLRAEIITHPSECIYREAWQPRVFLGVWEEVRTFAEAEPAGSVFRGPLAQRVCIDCQDVWVEGRPSDTKCNGYWVRRKPDASNACPSCQVTHAALAREARDHRAAVEAANAAAKKMCDYGERVELLDGLLDEALRWLNNPSHAESIRARRDRK